MNREIDEKLAELEAQMVQLRETLDVWEQSGLPKRTLIILLNHSTKVLMNTIRKVLVGLDTLFEDYFHEEDDG